MFPCMAFFSYSSGERLKPSSSKENKDAKICWDPTSPPLPPNPSAPSVWTYMPTRVCIHLRYSIMKTLVRYFSVLSLKQRVSIFVADFRGLAQACGIQVSRLHTVTFNLPSLQ